MDERTQDRIDRYLRNEMSHEETLLFEQEAMNDEGLRKQLGVNMLINRSLAGRQRKLNLITRWKRKEKAKMVSFAAFTSIAAILVIAFFLHAPDNAASSSAGMAMVEQKNMAAKKQEKVTETMESVLKTSDDKEIVETIENLENRKDIPSLNEMTEKQYVNYRQQNESGNEKAMIEDIYELYWLKIQSLLRMGQKDEALTLLRKFVTLEGEYKTKADSLLKEIDK